MSRTGPVKSTWMEGTRLTITIEWQPSSNAFSLGLVLGLVSTEPGMELGKWLSSGEAASVNNDTGIWDLLSQYGPSGVHQSKPYIHGILTVPEFPKQ